MKETTRNILNDAGLIDRQNKGFEELTSLFNGDFEGPVQLSGIIGSSCWSLGYDDVARLAEADFDILAEKVIEADTLSRRQFVPCVAEADFYGVHLVDKIIGADVFFESGQWYSRYLPNRVGDLKAPDIDATEAWQKVKEYTRCFLRGDVKLPLIGMAVLSSPLNIAVNLYGAEFLVAMIEEPEAAKHDLRIITDVIKSLHTWYIQNVPFNRLQPTVGPWRTQPYGFGQICGCSTHLVSPRLYEEFIMPLDEEILGLYPGGGMIHLCGSHSHLIPLFAKMPHLRSLQLNDLAADQLEYYVNGLREDQVIYTQPTDKVPLDYILKAAKKRRFVLIGDYDI